MYNVHCVYTYTYIYIYTHTYIQCIIVVVCWVVSSRTKSLVWSPKPERPPFCAKLCYHRLNHREVLYIAVNLCPAEYADTRCRRILGNNYIYIYIYIYREREIYIYIYMYIYIYICTFMLCVYAYIYIYI